MPQVRSDRNDLVGADLRRHLALPAQWSYVDQAPMRWLSFLVFLTIVISVFGSLHYYLYSRMDAWLQPSGALLALCFGALSVSPVAARLSERFSRTLYVPLWWIAATWMGVAMYLLVFLSAGHLVETAASVAGAWPGAPGWTVGAGTLLASVVATVALVHGQRPPRVTDLEVPLPRLPKQLDGLTMVHVSDVHIGSLFGLRKVRRLVAQINALEPDLVVVTGDLLDERPEALLDCADAIRSLGARHGVYAVTGNHEFYAGPEAALAWMRRASIRLIDSEVLEPAPGLLLAGFHDPTGIGWASRRFRATPEDIGRVLAGRDDGKPTIALYHQPVLVEHFARAGVQLLLCGHTHGGQLWPFRHLTSLRYRHTHGHYRVGGMQLYVCRGTGTWGPPMRFPCPAEIVRIRLRSDD